MQAISFGNLESALSNDLQFELNIEANSRNIYKETSNIVLIVLGCLIINSLTSVFGCPSVYSFSATNN